MKTLYELARDVQEQLAPALDNYQYTRKPSIAVKELRNAQAALSRLIFAVEHPEAEIE